MDKLLRAFIRPQGSPMAFPYTYAAKIAQFPYRFAWNESWVLRYGIYGTLFITFPIYWKIDKTLTGPENTALWRDKRKRDAEHHRKHMEKIWEVRT